MDTRRLVLVLILTFSSFMLWENWQKYNQPKPAAGAVAATTVGGSATPQPSAALRAPGDPVVAPAIADAKTSPGETFTIKTDLVTAVISAQGADLVDLELLRYKAHDNKDKTFVLFDAKHHYMAQSGLIGEGLPNHRSLFKRVAGPTELADGASELKVRFEATTQNGVKVAKIYTFKRGSYLIDVAWELNNTGDKPIAPHAYFQIQRDDVAPAGESMMVSTFTGPAVFTDADKYQKVDFSDIAKDKAKFAKNADNGWLAMVQHYFVSAWVPAEKTPREFYMRKVEGSNNVFQTGLIIPVQQLAPGNKAVAAVSLFAGPQEQATLKQLAPGLDLVVDYGWLTVVAAPIFWALEAIHKLVGNWGWAIVILTIAIKAVFFPLSASPWPKCACSPRAWPR